MEFESDVNKIKKVNDEQKLERAKLEERLNNLKEEETKIVTELEENNIKIENCETILTELQSETEKLIDEAKTILGLL